MRTTLIGHEPLDLEASDGTLPEGGVVPRFFAYLALGALLLDANLMVILGVNLPWVNPALAFGAIVGIPTFLFYGANPAGLARGSERLAVSVVLGLGLLMVAALGFNSAGPHLWIQAPLGAGGAVSIVDVAIVLLAVWAWPRHPRSYAIPAVHVGAPARRVLAGATTAVAVSVFGATRLNNGLGGGVTLAGLVLVLVSFAALLLWRNRIEPGAVAATIYLLSTAILLMTSLRGWYTTGHDIQREFQVFELTHRLGRWDMSRYQDGYNACLSITILPTIFARWTRVADPYVFKVFFQLLFGISPVLVYHLARRFTSSGLALVATIYFVAFPTFLQDMPFLNRQEIALLFLAAGLLCLFNPLLDLWRRKLWFCVLAVGMVLSHYSTTYVTIAVLLGAAGLRFSVPPAWALLNSIVPRVLRLVAQRWIWIVVFAAGIGLSRLTDERGAVAVVLAAVVLHWLAPKLLAVARDHDVPRRQGWLNPPIRSSALGLGSIGFVIAVSVVWTGLTGTSGGFNRTVSSVVAGLSGHPGSKSSDTAYSLLSTAKPSAARLLEQYRRHPPGEGARDAANFYDPAAVSQYPTPVVARSRLPATTLGALVQRVGVSLPAFNGLIRQGSARVLQLFIIVGLFVAVFARRRSVAASADLLYLGTANLFVLMLLVVLPALSVEYGLLRAFQQSLLVLDVFLVAGSLALIPRMFGRWKNGAAAAVALFFLASSTGVVTQLLGGYEPQLHLNNSGQYFDIYYVHPEELAATGWLRNNVDLHAAGGSQAVQTDSFTFGALQTLELRSSGNDIFPPLVRRDAYVFLGFSNVRKGQSTVFYGGDQITYRYPIDFLDTHKDLLYSTAGSRVYR